LVQPNDPNLASKLSEMRWELIDDSMIWVCVPDSGGPAFYSNVGKQDRFHHSSFTTSDLIGAGEWVVRKGRLVGLSGNSGHYRPTVDALRRCVQFLKPALQVDTWVLLWDTVERKYTSILANEFARAGSKGRYKTHQDEL
jgi:hypothetical protein